MIAVLAVLGVLAVVFGPMLWVRWAMARHGADRPDLPGTGGELARHLLDLAGLGHVRVERAPGALSDHYDPEARAVRLSEAHHDGRSVSAAAVAAHEVAHAVQDRDGMPLLRLRLGLVRAARAAERAAMVVLLAAPVVGVATGSPGVGLAGVAASLLLVALGLLAHLVTLPVELDASFGKALPALERGGYLAGEDLRRARSVLRAAAFTYVAGALVALLNVARWARAFR